MILSTPVSRSVGRLEIAMYGNRSHDPKMFESRNLGLKYDQNWDGNRYLTLCLRWLVGVVVGGDGVQSHFHIKPNLG